MNREILFRGKRVDNGEWVEGYFVKYQPCASKDEWIVGIVPDYASSLYLIEVALETVSRFTGLTDKNGRRIFEGDIVSAHGYSGYVAMDTDYWEIHWNHNFNRQLYLWHDVVEIIGNIHDNPELMGGEEK